jgi:hypothetical protein
MSLVMPFIVATLGGRFGSGRLAVICRPADGLVFVLADFAFAVVAFFATGFFVAGFFAVGFFVVAFLATGFFFVAMIFSP